MAVGEEYRSCSRCAMHLLEIFVVLGIIEDDMYAYDGQMCLFRQFMSDSFSGALDV